MKKQSLLISLLALLLLSGCTYRIVDFTIISTKNVDLSKAGTFKRATKRANGEDMAHIILGFALGRPNMKEAIDRAIQSTPGAVALVDGVVYSKFNFFFLYGQSIIIVEGLPLVDPSLASLNNLDLQGYKYVEVDSRGKIENVREISKLEYEKIKSKIVSKANRTQKFTSSREIVD